LYSCSELPRITEPGAPNIKGRFHISFIYFKPLPCISYISVNDLLTYSMLQSPFWEANWFAAIQEIPRISLNLKVHHRTHKLTIYLPTKSTFLISRNITWTSATRFGKCVSSSRRTQCQFLKTKPCCKAVIYGFRYSSFVVDRNYV
jgi:hypothetical protein